MPFLLDVPPPATSPAAIAACLVSAVAVLVSILSIIRKESREDGQTVSQRLKRLAELAAEHGIMHTGQVQAREKLADTFTASLRHQSDQHNSRFVALEKDTARVQQLSDAIVEMRADLKRLSKIEEKLDELTIILTRKIA